MEGKGKGGSKVDDMEEPGEAVTTRIFLIDGGLGYAVL